ncbi:glycosyltransferase family 2 protein [soil metagenome]
MLILPITFVVMIAIFIGTLNLVFSAEIFVGLTQRKTSLLDRTDATLVVIVPANDEAVIIGENLKALQSQLRVNDRILLIADNCHDNTAEIARTFGIEVAVRSDETKIGKGFALAFARDQLDSAPPDMVMIIDADCRIDASSIDHLMNLAKKFNRPVQAVSLLRPDLTAPTMVQVSNFAFAVKNYLRNGGMQKMTGRALLQGTGMVIPWILFKSVTLATDNVVEDLALGLDFAERGCPPMLAHSATVWSSASNTGDTLKQRNRWEGGFLATVARRALPIILRSVRSGNLGSMWTGLSLLVPPLSLLVVLNICVFALSVLTAVALGSIVPLIIIAYSGLVALLAIVLAWRAIGRPFLSGTAALMIPVYIIWKLPVYLHVFKRLPRTWQRTER